MGPEARQQTPFVREARLDDPDDRRAVTELVDAYAQDPLASRQRLPDEVRARLADGLRNHPTTIVFLAIDKGKPAGVAVCFLGFSTFAARPLINVHDLAVLAGSRRRGLGRLLLRHVEMKARELGCCKVTLEVREDNSAARALYRHVGFDDARFGGDTAPVQFLEKQLK
jgi:ribosomal protein S18 acetylase RimI-like enzyme